MKPIGTTDTSLSGGQELGDYEILSVAGIGGMGVVYRARQRSLGRIVALKVIREEVANTPEYRDRFLREARVAASVDHPHVVSVYDTGDRDGHLFLAMQWVDGNDLKLLLERTGRVAPDRAVLLATQLAGALDAVHGVDGLVHRDVKPANVLLRQVGGSDHAYLTDFGVAKPSGAGDQLTQAGLVVGTAGYLAPEQIRGGDPDAQSDLYALGCVTYELLTGQRPFRAENEIALSWAHANDSRPRVSDAIPNLGTRYDDFFATALAVSPEHRFSSGRAFAQGLAQAHGSQRDVPTQVMPRPKHDRTAIGPPTPLPPRSTPQPPMSPPPGQPNYGYVTPQPYQQARSGSPLALVVLGLVALAGISVGALAAAGVFSSKAASTQTVNSITAKPPGTRVPKTRTSPVVARGGQTSCGGDVSVGPDTSCPFGQNVEQQYLQSSGGDTDVIASSPVTGKNYTMHCTGSVPHVCTGGNNASVYFSSSPSGSSGSPAPSGGSGAQPTNLSACDPNISVGQGTTCPFAENVFRSYAADYKANGQQSSNTVSADSPVTHRSYTMSCTTDGTTVNCTGGNNAYVTFSLLAVQNY